MHDWGRTTLVGLVWLTAAATLVGSLLPVSCRCPDGTVKPFCLSLASAHAGCCCAGACCSAARSPRCQESNQVQDVEAGCCCSQHQPKSPPSNRGANVGGPCCTKTLAQGEFAVVTATKTAEAADAAAHLPLAVALSWHDALPPAQGSAGTSWETYGLPPPTDLVIIHQHLVI